MSKPARTIDEQLQLLKERGMLFHDEESVSKYLGVISYYRLKGYWWDMQADRIAHIFDDETYFEQVIERYIFDRKLRLILFEAIELIEIALRTKLIYILSLSYGPFWYLDDNLFTNSRFLEQNRDSLFEEFQRSQEIFAKDHKRRFPYDDPESWKILEVASLGTLSKYFKNLKHQLPEKAKIANEFGLNLHNEFSSWLEAIVYVRNIVAHHSRLWSRNMVKRPIVSITNPVFDWFEQQLSDVQTKKPFLIISCMVYLCNSIDLGNGIKDRIIQLLEANPEIPVYRLGFLNQWKEQPIWR